MPASNRYTTDFTSSLVNDLSRGTVDMSQWLSILNVKYLVIDKSEPLSANVILDENFERVWTSDTLDIYENHAVKPRLFSFSAADERNIQLWGADQIYLRSADGGPVGLALDTGHAPSDDTTVKATFQFANRERVAEPSCGCEHHSLRRG